MSEELKLKFRALGLLSASAIGGEACKDCPHNIPRMSAALLTGDGEALRDCAKLLYKDCELVPGGTKARIAELEAERDRLREALKEIVMLSTVDQVCNNCRHCQKLRNMDWCAWYCNAVDDSSTQGCRKFEMAGFHNSDVHTIARKALKGAEQEVE